MKYLSFFPSIFFMLALALLPLTSIVVAETETEKQSKTSQKGGATWILLRKWEIGSVSIILGLGLALWMHKHRSTEASRDRKPSLPHLLLSEKEKTSSISPTSPALLPSKKEVKDTLLSTGPPFEQSMRSSSASLASFVEDDKKLQPDFPEDITNPFDFGPKPPSPFMGSLDKEKNPYELIRKMSTIGKEWTHHLPTLLDLDEGKEYLEKDQEGHSFFSISSPIDTLKERIRHCTTSSLVSFDSVKNVFLKRIQSEKRLFKENLEGREKKDREESKQYQGKEQEKVDFNEEENINFTKNPFFLLKESLPLNKVNTELAEKALIYTKKQQKELDRSPLHQMTRDAYFSPVVFKPKTSYPKTGEKPSSVPLPRGNFLLVDEIKTFLDKPEEPFFCLSGYSGLGKRTALRKIEEALSRSSKHASWLVCRIPVSFFQDAGYQSIQDFVQETWELNENQLKILTQQPFLFLFEGGQKLHRKTITLLLKEFLHYSKSKAILSIDTEKMRDEHLDGNYFDLPGELPVYQVWMEPFEEASLQIYLESFGVAYYPGLDKNNHIVQYVTQLAIVAEKRAYKKNFLSEVWAGPVSLCMTPLGVNMFLYVLKRNPEAYSRTKNVINNYISGKILNMDISVWIFREEYIIQWFLTYYFKEQTPKRDPLACETDQCPHIYCNIDLYNHMIAFLGEKLKKKQLSCIPIKEKFDHSFFSHMRKNMRKRYTHMESKKAMDCCIKRLPLYCVGGHYAQFWHPHLLEWMSTDTYYFPPEEPSLAREEHLKRKKKVSGVC